MNKRITATVLAALAVSVPATAADLYIPADVPAPIISGVSVYDWSGLYFGIGGGTAISNNRVSTGFPAFSFGGIGDRGYFGKLTAGYDHVLSNGVVVGAAISGRYGDVDADWTSPGFTGEITSDYGIDVIGRVGYSITPRTLAYALAGYSWQHFKYTGSLPAAGTSTSWNDHGFVVGFGTETAIRNNWTWSSEYRYANYSGETIGRTASVDPVIHSFHSSLNYRLGGGSSGQTMEPVVYDWNGLKVGGAAGIGLALTDTTIPGTTTSFDSMSNEAFIAEINVGYDRVFGGHWLGGVVLAAGYDSGRAAMVNGGTTIVAKTEDFGFDALLRVGRIFNEQTMGYVIGGYSWQKMSATVGALSNSTGVSGFTIGTGVEFALSEKLTTFVETRYSGFQDYAVGAYNFDPSGHSVRAGAKWKLY